MTGAKNMMMAVLWVIIGIVVIWIAGSTASGVGIPVVSYGAIAVGGVQFVVGIFQHFSYQLQDDEGEQAVNNESDVDDLMDEFLSHSHPRLHHYSFVQEAIPISVHNEPDDFFTLMGQDPEGMIHLLWDRVCENCNEREGTDLCADDFIVSGMTLVDSRAILIKMPTYSAY